MNLFSLFALNVLALSDITNFDVPLLQTCLFEHHISDSVSRSGVSSRCAILVVAHVVNNIYVCLIFWSSLI